MEQDIAKKILDSIGQLVSQVTETNVKVDKLGSGVDELTIRLDGLTVKVDENSVKLDEVVSRQNKLEETVDRIAITTVETQARLGEVGARVSHIEEQHRMSYEKMDGFLTLINRHESEIAALRASMDRVRERLTVLEAKQV